ncbi:hypothetical protein GGR52DRAFT_569863 [Hypoxylon sp. FL1284]|nr:hypothetical protein GGR52DRAFT_569863 [Hypoxylon sp. FL1284]
MSGQQLIKYTIEHYRKDGVSEEALQKWFREWHIPRALPLMNKYGITKYSVYTRLPELCNAFQPGLHKVRPTWEVSQADFVLEYWMPDMDCFRKLVMDSEWVEGAAKDWDDWLDMSRSTVHIGYDTTYLEKGVIVN